MARITVNKLRDTRIPALYQAATLEEWTSVKELISRLWKAKNLRSLLIHIYSLILSALFYTIASILLRTQYGSERSVQIIKIILWYFPLLLEAVMHFLAMTQKGHVFYPTDRVFERSAAVFVVILGGGTHGYLHRLPPALTTYAINFQGLIRSLKGFSS